MSDDCLVCHRISLIKDSNNPYFVTELDSGYVVLGDFQAYKGYTLLLSKIHARELHLLENSFRQQLLRDLVTTGEAMYKAFSPKKLNYELLGNTVDSHLHWHIFPRRDSDPNPKESVWTGGRGEVYAEQSRPSAYELKALVKTLKTEFNIS